MRIWRLLWVVLLFVPLLTPPVLSRAQALGAASLPWVASTIAVGANPRGLGVDESRNLVYVSGNGDNSLWRIDGSAGTAALFSTAVSKPLGLAVDSVGNRVFVANNDQAAASIVDGLTGGLITAPGTAPDAYGVAFNPLTGKTYIVERGPAVLSRINPDGSVKNIALSGQPVWVALNPTLSRAYVSLFDRQAVAIVDTNVDEQVGEVVDWFGHAAGIAVNPNNGDVYVANAFEGVVTVMDQAGTTLKGLLDAGQLGAQIRNVAINPNTGHVFVTRWDTSTVYVFDSALVGGGSLLPPLIQIPVGAGPDYGIAVNRASNLIYVGNGESNTVSVIADTPPTLRLNADVLGFITLAGSNPAPRSVLVSNAGTGALDWSVAIVYFSGSNWLAVDPSTGADAPATVNVVVNAASLPQGVYTARLTFSSLAAANAPQSVDVRLVVAASIKRVFLPEIARE